MLIKTKLKIRKKFLPFSFPYIGNEEKKSVLKVLESGWLTTGKKTVAFEKEFARYTHAKQAVAVSSCTAAIHLCMAALGIQKGDEVILPSYTFSSTASEIIHLGATPVFVDIEPDTINLNPIMLEKKITSKTKAVIPTHYGGFPCDMDELLRIAKKHKLAIIDDAAHAHGTLYKDKQIGSLSSYGTCFSFYPTKNITTGEGGMITTSNHKLAKRLRMLSLHGISKDAWKRYAKKGSWYYEIQEPGYKYNLSDIQSVLGVEQLKRLDFFNKERKKLANRYNQILSGIAQLQLPAVKEYASPNWHLYFILGREWNFNQRNEFINKLKEWNIGTSVHFIPTHLHPYYKKNYPQKAGDLQVTEDIYSRIISLPIYPGMTLEDVEYVTDVIKECL